MKRILAVLVIAVMACGSAMAQKTFTTKRGVTFPANEISLSYHGLNLPEFANVLGGAVAIAITAGEADIDQINFSGAFGLQYDRYISKWIAFGVVGTVESFVTTYKDSQDDYNCTLLCLMPEAKFSWFRRNHVSMYSRVAVGAGYYISDDSDWMFACQVSPVGLEIGGKNVKGFLEIGEGMQGLGLGVRAAF